MPCLARRRRRGAALLLAMVILGLVSTLAAAMVWQQRRAVELEAAERDRTQSAWILAGALDWARLILREDQRNNQRRAQPVDSLDEPWATPLAEARLSTFLAVEGQVSDEGPEAFLSGSIVDAQSRFNLRSLFEGGKLLPPQLEALQRLCQQAGLPGDTGGRIAAGLRRAWYPAADDGDAAPMAPARLADLAWLGLDAATIEKLEPWVDLLPVATPVNVNTAPREVIAAAIDGLDLGSAERLVQQRQRKPFETLDELRAALPPDTVVEARRVSLTSSYFEVNGRLRLDRRVLQERSLLERRAGADGGEVLVRRRERLQRTLGLP